MEYLYQDPIGSVAGAAEVLGITPQSANSLIGELERIGILREITGFERNRLFRYESYVDLFSTTGGARLTMGEVVDEDKDGKKKK